MWFVCSMFQKLVPVPPLHVGKLSFLRPYCTAIHFSRTFFFVLISTVLRTFYPLLCYRPFFISSFFPFFDNFSFFSLHPLFPPITSAGGVGGCNITSAGKACVQIGCVLSVRCIQGPLQEQDQSAGSSPANRERARPPGHQEKCPDSNADR
jgi:hypothetical protein